MGSSEPAERYYVTAFQPRAPANRFVDGLATPFFTKSGGGRPEIESSPIWAAAAASIQLSRQL